MDRNPKPGATFYKFLANDDFRSQFRIPTEFVSKYGEILHSKMTLRTDHLSGKTWTVGVKQIRLRHFFTEGWSKFAEDVDLKNLEYLIFKFVGGSTIDVSVYEATGCKKDCSSSGNEAGVPGNIPVKVKTEDNQEMGSDAVRTWRFSKELKNHHSMTRMGIPKGFAIGTGIAKKREVTLQDAKGRKWPVKVTDRNAGMYALTAGWKGFLIGNDVLIGSVVSFEFIPGSGKIVEALVIKNGTGKENLIPARKRKGEASIKPEILESF